MNSYIGRLVVFGAGGHAKVVIDAWRACGGSVEFCLDDDILRAGTAVLGVAVGIFNQHSHDTSSKNHVAIGNNEDRRAATKRLESIGLTLISVVHPAACIAPTASIDKGTLIAAGAIVGPETRIGRGVIANHGCVVDHDCVIDDWCHVAPQATLGGGVRLGNSCLIGSNATVLPGLVIGAGATVGAGAVVTRDVAPGQVVVGVPAAAVVQGK